VESVTALITATGSFLGSPAMMALIAFGTGVGTMAVKHHYEAKPAIIGAVLPKEQRPATLSDVATIAADSSALIVKQLSAKIDALSAPVPMPATRLAPSKTRLIK
jgi:hypothetical protein